MINNNSDHSVEEDLECCKLNHDEPLQITEKIFKNRSNISIETAQKMERSLGNSSLFWLKLHLINREHS